jgi:hypothetical protein
MNNDQEQDRGEFAPAPTVFNDLTSLKHKQTVGPIESAMRERVLTDANGRKYITTEPNQFKPDWNTEAVLVEEMQRMAKRIEDLEAEQDCVGWFGYDTGLRLWFETNKGDDDAIPLYKDQQQRTWVGLTDKEVAEIVIYPMNKTADLVRIIEAKLKEKNEH